MYYDDVDLTPEEVIEIVDKLAALDDDNDFMQFLNEIHLNDAVQSELNKRQELFERLLRIKSQGDPNYLDNHWKKMVKGVTITNEEYAERLRQKLFNKDKKDANIQR